MNPKKYRLLPIHAICAQAKAKAKAKVFQLYQYEPFCKYKRILWESIQPVLLYVYITFSLLYYKLQLIANHLLGSAYKQASLFQRLFLKAFFDFIFPQDFLVALSSCDLFWQSTLLFYNFLFSILLIGKAKLVAQYFSKFSLFHLFSVWTFICGVSS